MSIETSSLHTTVADQNNGQDLQLLLETIENISRSMELQDLLQESIEAAQTVMDAKASSLILIDDETGELYVSMPTGPVKDEVKGKRIPPDEGICGWVLKHKKPFISNDPGSENIFYGDLSADFETRNIICLPLINKKEEVIGVLQALNRNDGKGFSEQDVPIFKALASHITIALERTRKQEKLQQKLDKKEVLLTEIHHRIKNNLATISALIEIESEEVDDSHAKDILKNTHSRISSMVEVHDMLCNKSIFEDVDLGVYLSKLSAKISDTLSDPHRKVDILLNADAVKLSANRALICGMILNELLVNIYKHAFQDMANGTIDIELLRLGDKKACLKVSDNGIGMPDNFDIHDHSSVGTWVISTLIKKLEAEVEIKPEDGTCFYVYFNL